MGFHVMLDWVANHTGWDNAWITEHPDWYTQKDGKIISPEGMGWPDVADLNYDNADMRKMDSYNATGELPTGVYTFSPWEFYIIATK